MVISRWLEKRPLLVVIAFSVSCLAALGIDIYVYVKDRKSEKLRVVAFIGLFVISVWASVIFTGAIPQIYESYSVDFMCFLL